MNKQTFNISNFKNQISQNQIINNTKDIKGGAMSDPPPFGNQRLQSDPPPFGNQ